MRNNAGVTPTSARDRIPEPPVPPRLIATDLDGTLLRDDKSVSPRTIAALAAAEQAGIEVFFVTGRPARWMGVVSDHVHGHGLAICGNGAAVVDLHHMCAADPAGGTDDTGRTTDTHAGPVRPDVSTDPYPGPGPDTRTVLGPGDAAGTSDSVGARGPAGVGAAVGTGGPAGTGGTGDAAGTGDTPGTGGTAGTGGTGGTAGTDTPVRPTGGHRFVMVRPLARSTALEVTGILRAAAPGTSFAVELTGGLHHESTYPPLHLEPAESVAPIEKLLAPDADIADQPVLKVLAYHPALTPDDFLALAREQVADRATITRSSPSALLEISGPGVSKASTLALCCAERGISPAEVIAFGDMPNDVEMLTWAGTSYAMGNAHPAVFAAASGRTAGNNDDGVAAVIEKILLNR